MEMVNLLRTQILGISAQIGEVLDMFFIPCLLLGAIALMVFARYSYRLLKFVLPIGGIVIGAIVGAALVGPIVETSLPAVVEYVNPFYLSAIVLAAVLGVICWKYHTFAILLIAVLSGYVVVGRVVKDFLLSLPFINAIANDVIRLKSFIVGVIICAICTVIVAFLVKRYFKIIYVIVTSIGVAAAALGFVATVFFATTSIATYASLGAAALGALIGWSFCYKQLGEVYADH